MSVSFLEREKLVVAGEGEGAGPFIDGDGDGDSWVMGMKKGSGKTMGIE